jgi:predicted TIM-barrel fold metal-dependent hydrolase
MPDVVDVHMHLYPDVDSARWSLETYEITEYGTKDDVAFAHASGLVEDAAALCGGTGPLDHGVVVNLFAPGLFRDQAAAALSPDLPKAQRSRRLEEIEDGLGDAMVRFNEWLMDALASRPTLTGFVAVDPTVRSPAANVAHLRAMAGRGAKGVKIHPVLQRFQPGDPRMDAVYEACIELGLVMLSHSGSNRGAEQYASPSAFAVVMRSHPDLRLVLAHMGGGCWRETADFARAFPTVAFDLSEIIEWLGASEGVEPATFSRLVREVGADRVMFGSDYPWYDPAESLQLLMELPALSDGEKRAMAGDNARRILGLGG